LTAQVGAHLGLVARETATLDLVALLVLSFPQERKLFADDFGHRWCLPLVD